MSSGKRRPKANRAQLRSSDPIDIRHGRQARQRRRFASLSLVGLAVLLTAAVVHGLGPPFSFRVGQRAERELRVKVDEFQRPNPIKTNTMRQQAARRVPPRLTNDPAAIQELRKQLEDLIDAIATAPRANLDDQRRLWTLDEQTIEDLRDASDTPERRDELRRRITEAFEPLIRQGVLGSNTLPEDEEEPGVPLLIRYEDEQFEIPRDRVLPERMIRLEGPVATDFIAGFVTPELGKTLFLLIAEKLVATPTLRYEEAETNLARRTASDRVPQQYDIYRRGRVLVEEGQTIQEEQLELLRAEHQVATSDLTVSARLRSAGSIVVLVAALFALIGSYVVRHEPRVAENLPRIAVLCGAVVGTIALARLLAWPPFDAELIPIALLAMILAIAYNPQFALLVTFGVTLLTSLAIGGGLAHFIVLIGGTAAGVLLLGEVRTRTKPIQVGAAVALGYFVLTWATGLWQNQPIALIATDSAWRAGWGLMTGFVLGGCLPFIESLFGILTGISLLELGDINHPLLQELVRRAPGTHNHSITVGTIAESAAEKVGADALLVRVGAYFHDIGKMLKPHYFIENQVAGMANRHANLAPAMSTLIIIGHVKDGADLGRQHKLPQRIIDLIEQHHGTTLVEYFYHEAARRCDADPDAATVQENAFRYPGPKPQSKEAAILMVADAVESASRTLSEPTPARVEGLVRDLIDKRLRDGQFDDCGLTLMEIALIRESLIKSLIGIYHGRVKYPEQRTA